MFSKDTISDSNGIVDVKVNQNSEEIVTITKDMRQIRIWVYINYKKIRPMPPTDELPTNVNHIDPHMHVFINNKKNIYVNLPMNQIKLNEITNIIIATSEESSDIALFSTKEGKNMYTIEI